MVVTPFAPVLAIFEYETFVDAFQHILCIAVNLDVDSDVLVELGLVYIHVDDFGLRGILRNTARDTVGEAHAHRQDHIGLLGHPVGRNVAVHTNHTDVVMVVEVHTAAAQQGAGNRYAGLVGAFCQDVFCSGYDDALSGYDERLLCVVQKLDGLVNTAGNLGGFVRADNLHHLAEGVLLVIDIVAHLLLRVLCEADEYRSGTVAAGDVECLRYHHGYFRSLGNLVVPLGDRGRNAQHVGLLEKVGSELVGLNLGGDADDGGGVHHSVGDARHEIGGAGTAGGQADADLA